MRDRPFSGASANAETGSREPDPSFTGSGPSGFDPARKPFVVNIRWGHLDRLPKCEHGRVFCQACGL